MLGHCPARKCKQARGETLCDVLVYSVSLLWQLQGSSWFTREMVSDVARVHWEGTGFGRGLNTWLAGVLNIWLQADEEKKLDHAGWGWEEQT